MFFSQHLLCGLSVRMLEELVYNYGMFQKNWRFFFVCICKSLRVAEVIVATVSSVGHGVGKFIGALRYNPEGRGIDSRWCHCNFSLI